jgi:hypothetical protein
MPRSRGTDLFVSKGMSDTVTVLMFGPPDRVWQIGRTMEVGQRGTER